MDGRGDDNEMNKRSKSVDDYLDALEDGEFRIF